MDLCVRPARTSDLSDITRCYLRSWRAAHADSLPSRILDEETEKRRWFDWSGGIASDTSTVLVADDVGDVIGVVQADVSLAAPRDLPEITMLYVDPSNWGQGVATMLLRAGLDWIGQRDHHGARLRVVEDHFRARRFYEREGWVIDPTIEPDRNDFFRLIYYRIPLPN